MTLRLCLNLSDDIKCYNGIVSILKMLTMINVAAGLHVIEGGGIHVSYVIGGVLSVLAILILIAALIIYRWIKSQTFEWSLHITRQWNDSEAEPDMIVHLQEGKKYI